MRYQILGDDEGESRYKKQCDSGIKATRTVKLFSDLMIYLIIEKKSYMKYS